MDKTFVFNKNNICTNPNTPISWISEGKPSMDGLLLSLPH